MPGSRTMNLMDPMDRRRARGSLLLEVMITLTILTLGIVGVLSAIRTNYRVTRDLASQDQAHFAFETAINTLRATPFASLCTTLQDSVLTVPWDTLNCGAAAQVQVHFDTNERTLPAEYGPVVDLDGDGLMSTIN